MRPFSSALFRSIALAGALVLPPGTLTAQLIGLKTVPVAAGDQFSIFPSRNVSMGGVFIALQDPLLDPFVNPAKGGRLGASTFFSSPTFYSISDGNGAVRTLPVGMLFASDRWFAGAVAAMQQIDMSDRAYWNIPRMDPRNSVALPDRQALADALSTNKYFQALMGRQFGGGKFSLAGSIMLADLSAIDGIEQLFANAWEIEEFGHLEDYRVGLTANLPGERTIEAVLVHNRLSMTHNVTSVTWAVTDSVSWRWTPTVTRENNLERTSTWGAHLGYVQPVGDSQWRVGGILTANRKQHPKIPTYDLSAVVVPTTRRVPRDPGDSWAYNIGMGISKQAGETTFGLDVIYEPAKSYTWADETTDVTAADGSIIPAGGKTVENWFTFSNASANVGINQDIDNTAIQLGLRVRGVEYRLRQHDHVTGIRRTQREDWIEWTPTWGFRVGFSDIELRYVGWASSASHFPFIDFGSGRLDVQNPNSVAAASDVLAAPRGALTIPDVTVVTHRIAISVPIR
jgi:hypothetical protein